MPWLNEFVRRLGVLLRRSQFDEDLRDEMRLHLQLREEQNVRQGIPPAEAATVADRSFGNPTRLREHAANVWSLLTLEQLIQDLRYGARTLRRTPAFTTVAVTVLALGIGANTAIFSIVNSVLLRPLDYAEADRLVTILHRGTDPVAPANYIDWRDQSHSFAAMAAAEYWSPNVSGGEFAGAGQPAEHLIGLRLTQNMLPMLGVSPLLGQFFEPGKDVKGADHNVILSYRLWQRRFHGDSRVVGRPMTLNGEVYTVLGVMPREFRFAPFWATRAELWAPLAFGDRAHERGGNSLRIFARLRPGVGIDQARTEMERITARLEEQYPGSNRGVLVRSLKENVVGKIETPLLIVLGAVGVVLLIACANVAHMLLARTAGRQKEIAVRAAMGAGRARVVRQLLTENLLLGGMGAALGLLLALALIRVLVSLGPVYIPRVEQVSVDGKALCVLVVSTILTTLLFGLTPAMGAASANLSDALKIGGRDGSGGSAGSRLRGLLTVSEFALAFILLVGAGLMVRSFVALELEEPGFNPHNLLSMIVSVSGREFAPEPRELFYRQLLERVRGLPGVEAASGINHLPLAGDQWSRSFEIEGRPIPQPGESPVAVYRVAMPGYFETMRLPIRRGRAVAWQDDARAPDVVVINERAAQVYWPGEDPIGKRVVFGEPRRTVTIVGVAAEAKQSDWAVKTVFPEVYLAALQDRAFRGYGHADYLTLVVRTKANPADMARSVQEAVWSFDRNLPVSEVLTMDDVVAKANAQPQFEMMLLGAFGVVALVLAAVGIYGVLSYAVSTRTREIGIRMSLGASRADVLRMVVGQGMGQALIGTGIGVAGAILLTKLLSKILGGMLFGVDAADPATFVAVGLLLGVVALGACGIPARKATRIQPMAALQGE